MVCVVGRMRDLILQLSKSSIYSTKPFQCHMELTLDVVERLIAHSEKDLSRAAEYRFVDTPEALRAHDYSEMNQVLFGFLDKLEARYKAAQA